MRYAAKKTFQYGERMLDRGQVISLAGLRNDARLVALGYFWEVPDGAETYRCQCGAEFMEGWQRTAHGDMRHPETWVEAQAAPGKVREARRKSILEVASA